MIPIVATLMSQGLSLLANAVVAKGQDVIEEKLGVKLEAVSPEQLRELEIKHEEFLLDNVLKNKQLEIEAEKVAQTNVTQRWQADMLSDSWLSKNIRPLVLLFLLTVYTLFSVASGFNFTITQAYVELLAQLLMLVMGAYFASRGVEKVASMKHNAELHK